MATHDHSHSAHEHGTMDIRAQEQTFAGFIRLVTWSVAIIILLLIFLGLVNI